jgi:hypothetical protein
MTAPAPASEPHRPPAPPLLPLGPSAQPVTPAHAHPAPIRAVPDLPTRNRAAAAPDATLAAPSAASDPLADEDAGLAAALAAFDRSAHTSMDLPTRNRDDQRYTAGYGDDPTGETPEVSVASPLGADQLRARLRAFQSEFRTGQSSTRTDANPSSAHGPTSPGDDHA